MTTPNEQIAETLQSLLREYGRDLASNPSRLGALLRDVAGTNRLEISLLLAAAEEGIPAALESQEGPTSDRSPALVRRLADARGLTTENATWAVGVWQKALRPSPVPVEREIPPTPDLPVVPAPAISVAGAETVMGGVLAAPPPSPAAATKQGSTPRTLVAIIGAAVVMLGAVLWFVVGPGHSPGVPLPPIWATKTASGAIEGASVTMSWTPPADGAEPTGYEILRDGGSIAQTASTAYTDEDITWGEQHDYQVVAVAGDARSGPSETWTAKVSSPSLADARLTGSFASKVVQKSDKGFGGKLGHTATWVFDPTCETGPCDVVWRSTHTIEKPPITYTGTLAREGATYSGTAKEDLAGIYCSGTPVRVSYVYMTMDVTAAGPSADGTSWDATRLSGSMLVKFPATQCRAGDVYLQFIARPR